MGSHRRVPVQTGSHRVAQWQDEVAVQVNRTRVHLHGHEFEAGVIGEGHQVHEPAQVRKDRVLCLQIVDLLKLRWPRKIGQVAKVYSAA